MGYLVLIVYLRASGTPYEPVTPRKTITRMRNREKAQDLPALLSLAWLHPGPEFHGLFVRRTPLF
jgi:hypothetical protein